MFEYLDQDLKQFMDLTGRGPANPLDTTVVQDFMYQLVLGCVPPTPQPTPPTLGHFTLKLSTKTSTLNPPPSTLHPQPFTADPTPSTLSPQPLALSPQPSTPYLNP